ncbi:MAG: cytochrome c [Pseudomonadales bacterium]|nr:cytochrome c [Pseudomonadales bacterium]
MRAGRISLFFALFSLAAFFTTANAQEVNGEQIYTVLCTQCHGVQGDGRGINASHMSVQPRSHIDEEEMSARTDQELYKVIEQGGKSINKSVLMPAWGDNLNQAQIEALVKHLRKLCCSN